MQELCLKMGGELVHEGGVYGQDSMVIAIISYDIHKHLIDLNFAHFLWSNIVAHTVLDMQGAALSYSYGPLYRDEINYLSFFF